MVVSFIQKLYRIIHSNLHTEYIFIDSNDLIHIPDINTFSKEVLPLYYKHNNYKSFLRQLNAYNFNTQKIDNNKYRTTNHYYFKKNNKDNLEKIQRKKRNINKKKYQDNFKIDDLRQNIDISQDEFEIIVNNFYN